MGEVYRATDTRLHREVAVKVCVERFSERFEREARAIASLNHPNICTLYDVGPNYLVMELVEGQTLAARIKQGALPLEAALAIARQIADALEAAHEKGITHRDLKPGNVIVKEDGAVKVLDFGLAKVANAAPASGRDPELSPTISMHATQAGVILGTAAYMAPEQARGKPVDKRADIWAFGVVLYEMVAGKRLFQGEDLTDILASVVKEQPDLSAAPVELQGLLKKCLGKDPRKRLRDIGDAWELLDKQPVSIPPAATSPLHRWLWPAVAAVLLAVAAIGWLRRGPVETRSAAIAMSILPPPDKRLASVGDLSATPLISPDGMAVLYVAGGGGSGGLYMRRLDSLSATLVPTEKATNQPCWSADSASVIYPTQSGLLRVRLPDGAPETMGPFPGIRATRGCSANANGAILISAVSQYSDRQSLFLLPAPGSEFQELTLPKLGSLWYPEFLPNGKDFLFSVRDSGVYLASLEGGKVVNPVRLMENPHQASYTPAGEGSLLFVRDDNLYAQKLDLGQRKLVGESRLIQEGIGSIVNKSEISAEFSVSRSGTIAWRPGKAASSQVTTFDRTGKVLGTSGPDVVAFNLSLSPDGTKLLAMGGESTLLLNAGQPGSQDLDGSWFSWFPDGSGILGIDGEKIMKRLITGGETVDLGSPTPVIYQARDLSPDGTQLLYLGGRNGEKGLLAWPLGGTAENRKATLLAPSGNTFISHARFSPDGRWIVYEQDGLYVQPFPGPGLRRQIGPPGIMPLWRGDGREILEVAPAGVMSIPVTWVRGEPQFGAPTPLFPLKVLRAPVGSFAAAIPWTVSRDGSRIYWLQGVEQPDSNVIDVRTNAVN